ncbi:hypothetical protein ACFWRC_09230 [Streptomyces albidoflavus]
MSPETKTPVSPSVLMVILSPDGKAVLLERPGKSPWWCPPRVDVPAGLSCDQGARWWTRRWQRRSDVRRGRATCRLGADSGRLAAGSRLLIYRLVDVLGEQTLFPAARWVPLAALSPEEVAPFELVTYLTGYVEGWIPNGLTTLDR